MCHVSNVIFILLFIYFSDVVVELFGGGSVINGAYPVQVYQQSHHLYNCILNNTPITLYFFPQTNFEHFQHTLTTSLEFNRLKVSRSLHSTLLKWQTDGTFQKKIEGHHNLQTGVKTVWTFEGCFLHILNTCCRYQNSIYVM